MKRNIFVIAVMLLIVVAGCNRSAKTTENDVKQAEAALFNEDMTANMEAVPQAIETFCKYAEENPEAENAPEYLFKAVEVSINTHQDAKQSIELVDKLVSGYPEYDKDPVALFMLASFVYEDQQQEYDKARETYRRIVDSYPNSPFAKDAAIAMKQVGMTPEQLIEMFEKGEKSEDGSQE